MNLVDLAMDSGVENGMPGCRKERSAGTPAPVSLMETIPGASVFHTNAWQRVIKSTYGHEIIHLVETTDRGPIAAPLAVVDSPFLGRRLVSFPFSDYVPFLGQGPDVSRILFDRACRLGRERGCRYLEIRGPVSNADAVPFVQFHRHELRLSTSLHSVWKGLSSGNRRAIRRARTSGVAVEFFQSRQAVRAYYRLHCKTRKRQGTPPQSYKFFEAIAAELISPGNGFVALAKSARAGDPIAGAVFLTHGESAVFKFGASDKRFQSLRPNNLIMWQAMEELVRKGFATLDLGRTAMDNPGLRQFKRSWGGREELIEYFRYDLARGCFLEPGTRKSRGLNKVIRSGVKWLPTFCSRLAGALIYRHIH